MRGDTIKMFEERPRIGGWFGLTQPKRKRVIGKMHAFISEKKTVNRHC
jgi:hypothetical protein